MKHPAFDPHETPVALTIATSDSGGGAGIQADLKTFAARGAFGASVFCALTAQNPREVSAIAELETDFIRRQLESVFSFFTVRAAKTGMLFSERNIRTVADFMSAHPDVPLVVDPVMVATSGAVLLQPEAIETLQTALFPRATLITPNLDEAGVLLGHRPRSRREMREAGRALVDRHGVAILLKGGHLEHASVVPDLLFLPHEGEPLEFTHERIEGVNTHGSGCTLSAAITAELAGGEPLAAAVENALAFIESALRHPVVLHGERFLGH